MWPCRMCWWEPWDSVRTRVAVQRWRTGRTAWRKKTDEGRQLRWGGGSLPLCRRDREDPSRLHRQQRPARLVGWHWVGDSLVRRALIISWKCHKRRVRHVRLFQMVIISNSNDNNSEMLLNHIHSTTWHFLTCDIVGGLKATLSSFAISKWWRQTFFLIFPSEPLWYAWRTLY